MDCHLSSSYMCVLSLGWSQCVVSGNTSLSHRDSRPSESPHRNQELRQMQGVLTWISQSLKQYNDQQ